MTVTYRDTKGSSLSNAEIDSNFRTVANRYAGGQLTAASAVTFTDEYNYFIITGATPITSFTDVDNGFMATLEFNGASTLTNSANLILPGGANITTAAGDTAIIINESVGVWRCVGYQRAANAPNDALTATRVPFVDTDGNLTDDADMTFATDTLTVDKIVGTTSITGDLTGNADTVTNGVTADAVITDNVIVRGHGGAKVVQETGITVEDTTNNVSGMGTLGCGAVTSTGAVEGTSITDGTATISGGALTSLTTPLTVAQGGTGLSDAVSWQFLEEFSDTGSTTLGETTSIPSTCIGIKLVFLEVVGPTAEIQVQISDSGGGYGVVEVGMVGINVGSEESVWLSSGGAEVAMSAVGDMNGIVDLMKMGTSNTWGVSGTLYEDGANEIWISAGTLAETGVVDRLKVTSTLSNFSAGTVAVYVLA